MWLVSKKSENLFNHPGKYDIFIFLWEDRLNYISALSTNKETMRRLDYILFHRLASDL